MNGILRVTLLGPPHILVGDHPLTEFAIDRQTVTFDRTTDAT